MERQNVEQLAEWMRESEKTVVLTGAGMSTESGIPDFRSKKGWWKKIDPMSVSTTEALENEYELFHDFYQVRLTDLNACRPHSGHHVLADWEKQGLLSAIVTQNVDGFHHAAGNEKVFELHGSLRSILCSECGRGADEESFLNHKACLSCEGNLRPDIVLFGEMLPQDVWGEAIREIEQSDLLIVIGSSLKVAPANELPFLSTGKKVIINNEETYLHNAFDLHVDGNAGTVLETLQELVKEG